MKKDFLKLTLIGIIVVLATVLSWYLNKQSMKGIDDANIYFVYMKNFADGHGFVYNVGGEKVEGFTSLLWTLIGAFFFYISNSPEILLLITNIGLVTFALWKLFNFLDSYLKHEGFFSNESLLLLGLLFVIPGYFDWTIITLMETGLWNALLLLSAIYLMEFNVKKQKIWSEINFCFLIILMILCRPESLLWVCFFIFFKFLKNYFTYKSIGKSFVKVIPSLLIFGITTFCLISWRLHYFGYPFPNTFYAKVSSDIFQNFINGFLYLFVCFENNPLVILTFLISLFYIYTIRKDLFNEINYNYLLCIGITFFTILIPLYTGGDHFGYSRFMQPTMPIILLSFILLLHYFKFKWKSYYVFAFIIFASFIPNNTIYRAVVTKVTPISHEFGIALRDRNNSEKLNLFFKSIPNYPSQGVLTAGGSAYFYKGITIDLLGLNNVEMAHRKKVKNKNTLKDHASFNKDVFFKQNPDLFWYSCQFVENTKITDIETLHFGETSRAVFQGVHLDKRFSKYYQCVLISNSKLDYSLEIFASITFLKELDPKIYTFKKLNFE